mgnify:CR=1 FL=1
MKLAEKLVHLRKEKGLSQYDVASALNVSRQAISRWESGNSAPSTDNLKCLSGLYDVSVDFLLNEEIEQPDHGEPVVGEDQPEGKQWLSKKTVVALLILLMVAVAVVGTIYLIRESQITSVQEMEIENGTETDGIFSFDFDWDS